MAFSRGLKTVNNDALRSLKMLYFRLYTLRDTCVLKLCLFRQIIGTKL